MILGCRVGRAPCHESAFGQLCPVVLLKWAFPAADAGLASPVIVCCDKLGFELCRIFCRWYSRALCRLPAACSDVAAAGSTSLDESTEMPEDLDSSFDSKEDHELYKKPVAHEDS
eukprot:s932_g2.t1